MLRKRTWKPTNRGEDAGARMELVPYPLFSTHRLWARTLIVGFPLINFIVVRAPLHHCATFARFPGSPPHSCSRSITGGIPSVCGTPSTIAASPQGTHFDLVSSACTVRLLHRIRRALTPRTGMSMVPILKGMNRFTPGYKAIYRSRRICSWLAFADLYVMLVYTRMWWIHRSTIRFD